MSSLYSACVGHLACTERPNRRVKNSARTAHRCCCCCCCCCWWRWYHCRGQSVTLLLCFTSYLLPPPPPSSFHWPGGARKKTGVRRAYSPPATNRELTVERGGEEERGEKRRAMGFVRAPPSKLVIAERWDILPRRGIRCCLVDTVKRALNIINCNCLYGNGKIHFLARSACPVRIIAHSPSIEHPGTRETKLIVIFLIFLASTLHLCFLYCLQFRIEFVWLA